jgi:hypothetical protein
MWGPIDKPWVSSKGTFAVVMLIIKMFNMISCYCWRFMKDLFYTRFRCSWYCIFFLLIQFNVDRDTNSIPVLLNQITLYLFCIFYGFIFQTHNFEILRIWKHISVRFRKILKTIDINGRIDDKLSTHIIKIISNIFFVSSLIKSNKPLHPGVIVQIVNNSIQY